MSEATGHQTARIPAGELVLRGAAGTVVATVPEQSGPTETRRDGGARTGELIVGEHLLTVNGPEGSSVQPLPENRRPQPPAPRQITPGPARYALAGLLEREEQCARLRELLGQGRSVRLTGPHGSGRSAVLEAVATSCAGLLPGGVVRLSARHRPLGDLLQDLYTALGGAPGHRPDRRELPGLLAGNRAIVLVDDVDFGGEALDDLLAAAPDCAFLIAATADAPTPASGTPVEESRVAGLSRAGSLALLGKLAGRSLDESERAWAVDLWFESEGLPLRFVQAAALLRHRELAIDALAGGLVDPEEDPVPLPSVAESAAPAARIARGLAEPARRTLRLAATLGGAIPTPPHLPALIDVGHGEAALEELIECGLAEAVPGGAHRLVEGTAELLAEEWPDLELPAAAQHFAWWTGHIAVTEEQIARESEVLLAVLRTAQEAGRHADVVLLARACAPSFGLALRWGAWERTLRYGLESARATGAVAEEAWFHHELGVLTFCAGAFARSRAELEAAVALRGALADARGTANGRKVLELLDQAVVISGSSAVSGRGREDGLRRFRALAPFAVRRVVGRHAADDSTRPASRRHLLIAAGTVLLMGVLGAGVATAVTALSHSDQPGSSTPGTDPDPSWSFPAAPDAGTPSTSGSASASGTPSAAGHAQGGTGAPAGQGGSTTGSGSGGGSTGGSPSIKPHPSGSSPSGSTHGASTGGTTTGSPTGGTTTGSPTGGTTTGSPTGGTTTGSPTGGTTTGSPTGGTTTGSPTGGTTTGSPTGGTTTGSPTGGTTTGSPTGGTTGTSGTTGASGTSTPSVTPS